MKPDLVYFASGVHESTPRRFTSTPGTRYNLQYMVYSTDYNARGVRFAPSARFLRSLL